MYRVAAPKLSALPLSFKFFERVTVIEAPGPAIVTVASCTIEKVSLASPVMSNCAEVRVSPVTDNGSPSFTPKPVVLTTVFSTAVATTSTSFVLEDTMLPKTRSLTFVMVMGLIIVTLLVAEAVPSCCPKEMFEKAKMAAESVKNFKIVVFIMNIVKFFKLKS